MEPSSSHAPGSAADVGARLLLWSRREGAALARVEFDDERIRQRVVAQLRGQLRHLAVPFHELELAPAATPDALIRGLIQELQRLPAGVFSLSGFATALPADAGTLNAALYAFNFHRENLARTPHRQVWWLPTYLAELFVRVVPDLDSWFVLHLHLTETVPFLAPDGRLIETQIQPTVNREDALRRAEEQLRRFDRALEQGADKSLAVRQLGLPALIALREARDNDRAATLAARLTALSPEMFQGADVPLDDPGRLQALLERAEELRESGFRDEAVELQQRATGLARELARQNWAVYAPGLASSLNNLGNLLSGRGRKEEALELSEEAVKVYRELAGQNWTAYAPDLAMSLNNLGIRLSELGRKAEALAPGEEAVKVYREMARQNWAAYAPSLAMSLSNLGVLLGELGRKTEALRPSEEAVKIRREQAEQNWATHSPHLAMSLNNLGIRLSALGRKAEAVGPSEEAVKVYRELAGQNWTAYAPDLAISLNNLAVVLSALERKTEALRPSEEAVKIRRELAGQNWAAHAPDLAMSLNNLGVLLGLLGRKAEALVPSEEAVKVYRELAGQNWAAYAPALARGLAVQGLMLEGNGRPAEALAALDEGIRTLTHHLQQLPAAHTPLMSALVQDYLRLAEATGMKPDEALLAPVNAVLNSLRPAV